MAGSQREWLSLFQPGQAVPVTAVTFNCLHQKPLERSGSVQPGQEGFTQTSEFGRC